MIKLMTQQEQDFRAKYPGVSLSASNGITRAFEVPNPLTQLSRRSTFQ